MFADVERNDLYSLLWRSTIDWPIVNLLSKGSVAITRLYIVYKFGELPSSNLGVYAVLLKRAIFDAIHTQFDDDLYS